LGKDTPAHRQTMTTIPEQVARFGDPYRSDAIGPRYRGLAPFLRRARTVSG